MLQLLVTTLPAGRLRRWDVQRQRSRDVQQHRIGMSFFPPCFLRSPAISGTGDGSFRRSPLPAHRVWRWGEPSENGAFFCNTDSDVKMIQSETTTTFISALLYSRDYCRITAAVLQYYSITVYNLLFHDGAEKIRTFVPACCARISLMPSVCRPCAVRRPESPETNEPRNG